MGASVRCEPTCPSGRLAADARAFRHSLRATRAPSAASLAVMARTGFISTTGVAKRPRSDWDRAIGAIAPRQHGVVTHAQLVALGMGSSTIRARVAANRFHRLHHGVFAVGYLPLAAHGYWAAAVLACGPGAALSFASCGALHEIRPSSATLIDVTTPGRVGRRRDGLRIHPAATIVPGDLTVVAGIPCTTVARTICDLAGVLSQDATEYMIHRAQAKRVFVRAEVEAIVRRSPSRRGTRALRRILSISDRSEDEVRSGLERLMLRICRTSGLPQPEVDHSSPAGGWSASPSATFASAPTMSSASFTHSSGIQR